MFITSCSTQEYIVKYDEPEPELITSEDLRDFINQQDETKIVLRVPSQSTGMTEQSPHNSIYNTIEKELLKANFIVRDRAIFDEIVGRSGEGINYSELQEQTDTDLILELVNIDTKVAYTTNYYFDKQGNEISFDGQITDYGASVEFRVVLLEKNKFAGSYVFNYAPCSNGCALIKTNSGLRWAYRDEIEENNIKDPYQYVEKSVVQEFIKGATAELLNEIK